MSRGPMLRGVTSVILPFKLEDSSGTAVTGKAYNESGLKVRYLREGDTSWKTSGVDFTLVSGTVGSYVVGGWAELGQGKYQVCLPDSAYSQGTWVLVEIYGISGVMPCEIMIPLWAVNPQSASNFGLSTLNGHVPQSGDSYVRIGAGGSGLTSIIALVDDAEGGIAAVQLALSALQSDIDALILAVADLPDTEPDNAGIQAAQDSLATIQAAMDELQAAVDLLPGTAPDNTGIQQANAKLDTLATTVGALPTVAPDNSGIEAANTKLENLATAVGALPTTAPDNLGIANANEALVELAEAVGQIPTTAPDNAGIAAAQLAAESAASSASTAAENATAAGLVAAEAASNALDAKTSSDAAAAAAGSVGDSLDLLSERMDGLTALISGVEITVMSIVAAGGAFTLYQGYDYVEADGRAVQFRVSGLPEMDTEQASQLLNPDETEFQSGTVTSTGTPTEYLFSFDFTREFTDQLLAGTKKILRLAGTTSAGRRLMISEHILTVK